MKDSWYNFVKKEAYILDFNKLIDLKETKNYYTNAFVVLDIYIFQWFNFL